MSAENTNYDVSIASYNCTKQKQVHIRFLNDWELVFDTHRVRLEIIKSRLYFIDDNSKGSLAVQKNGTVMACQQFDKLKKFEGYFDLKHDEKKNAYYIDKNEMIKHYEHTKPEQKGSKKQQPRREITNKPDKDAPEIHITEQGEKLVENMKIKKLTEIKNPISDKTFIFGLVNLLKEQCKGNIKALYTINTLEEAVSLHIK